LCLKLTDGTSMIQQSLVKVLAKQEVECRDSLPVAAMQGHVPIDKVLLFFAPFIFAAATTTVVVVVILAVVAIAIVARVLLVTITVSRRCRCGVIRRARASSVWGLIVARVVVGDSRTAHVGIAAALLL
jgi:hypothetical protein